MRKKISQKTVFSRVDVKWKAIKLMRPHIYGNYTKIKKTLSITNNFKNVISRYFIMKESYQNRFMTYL